MAAQDNLARKPIYIPATQPEAGLSLRVAAYCRVSTDSEDQLNSFAAQQNHYYDYTEKPFVKYPTHPTVSSSFPAGYQYGGKVQSNGWLRPPNFLRAVSSNLILAKTAVHDWDSGRVLLRYQGKNKYEWRENNEHP